MSRYISRKGGITFFHFQKKASTLISSIEGVMTSMTLTSSTLVKKADFGCSAGPSWELSEDLVSFGSQGRTARSLNFTVNISFQEWLI